MLKAPSRRTVAANYATYTFAVTHQTNENVAYCNGKDKQIQSVTSRMVDSDHENCILFSCCSLSLPF